jgi:hypothetical protein
MRPPRPDPRQVELYRGLAITAEAQAIVRSVELLAEPHS